MAFTPPRCPNTACPFHRDPPTDRRFYRRRGSFVPECRGVPVPRFHCKGCHKSFSRQTFRADYRDHRPDLNVLAIRHYISGTGIRQTARILHITKRNLELKLRKHTKTIARLQRNLCGPIRRQHLTLTFDELETFTSRRTTSPVTVPIVIDRKTFFVFSIRAAPIRPSGKMTAARRRALAAHEAVHGKRPHRSKAVVWLALRDAARACAGVPRVSFVTDKKKLYPQAIRRFFGDKLVEHQRIDSRRRRDTKNPMFQINLTNAMVRDNLGRCRRRSWLVSKKRGRLERHAGLFIAYRNYVRVWRNGDRATPAMLIGLEPCPWTFYDLVSWRQDWGAERSVHPRSDGARTIVQVREAYARAKAA